MFKKMLAVVMVSLMCFTMFSGCSKEAKAPKQANVGKDEAQYVGKEVNEYSPKFTVKMIVTGAENKVIFSGTVTVNSPNPVVLQALEAGLTEKGENWTDGGNGFITQISGYTNDSSTNYYWGYTVNGTLGHLSSGEFQLRDGDLIEWTYKEMKS